MACSGCDARREWLKRKAQLLAQRLKRAQPAPLKEEKQPDEPARPHHPAQ